MGWSVYIEDAFIEAIKTKGISYKRVPLTEKNIYVALSQKTVRLYRDRFCRDGRGGNFRVLALKR